LVQDGTFGTDREAIRMDIRAAEGIDFLLWGEPGRICFWGLAVFAFCLLLFAFSDLPLALCL
jgi:hypothetical protein